MRTITFNGKTLMVAHATADAWRVENAAGAILASGEGPASYAEAQAGGLNCVAQILALVSAGLGEDISVTNARAARGEG